jgi:hypothetical protein
MVVDIIVAKLPPHPPPPKEARTSIIEIHQRYKYVRYYVQENDNLNIPDNEFSMTFFS